MRAVVQRVSKAAVTVDGEELARIGPGLCVLVGVTHDDTPERAGALAGRLWRLRVFPDADGRMDLSAEQMGAEILVVSQFTLHADTSRGRRPGWSAAAPASVAEPLVDAVVAGLRDLGATVASGRFGADMQVALVNDGPVTLILEA